MRNKFNFETNPLTAKDRTEENNSPEFIRRLQKALNRALGMHMPLDGRVGFRTRKAIRAFQRQKGLPSDGSLGSETLKALFGAGGRRLSKTGTMRETSEFETSNSANANRLMTGLIGWTNNHREKALSEDEFEAEWESEIGLENQISSVGAINWCQMRQNIARIARAEERRWTRPNGTKIFENQPDRLPILESYWRTVPGFTTAAGAAARDSANNRTAWSAAFICFVMHTAGVRQVHGFEFSQRHLGYIVGALRNRERSNQNRVFWLADSIEAQSEAAPKVGDLLCFNRIENGRMTRHSYSSLRSSYWLNGNQSRVPQGSSHCSIVVGSVERNGRRFIQAIGGNESAPGSGGRGVTVGLREIPTDRFGGIPNPQNHNIFGIIRIINC